MGVSVLLSPRLGARLPDWYLEWARKKLLREGLDIDPAADYLLYADDLGLMKTIVQSTDSLDAPRDVQIDRTEWVALESMDSKFKFLQGCG